MADQSVRWTFARPSPNPSPVFSRSFSIQFSSSYVVEETRFDSRKTFVEKLIVALPRLSKRVSVLCGFSRPLHTLTHASRLLGFVVETCIETPLHTLLKRQFLDFTMYAGFRMHSCVFRPFRVGLPLQRASSNTHRDRYTRRRVFQRVPRVFIARLFIHPDQAI